MFCFASGCGGSVEGVAESWEVVLVASVGVQEVGGTGKLLLSVVEAAAVLSVSRTTLYELMWRDEIKPIHIGRSVRSGFVGIAAGCHYHRRCNQGGGDGTLQLSCGLSSRGFVLLKE